MRVNALKLRDYSRIEIVPLTGSIGAEVSNIDLRELDDETFAELKEAWLTYKVLFFRDQHLTQSQQVDYAKRYGELEIHPFANKMGDIRPDRQPKRPEVVTIESTPEDFHDAAGVWHSDVTFRERPPMGSILYAKVIPAWGGDTCFADMELAYDLLPDEIKEKIEGLQAVHSFVNVFGKNLSEEERKAKAAEWPDQLHPVVRTHPETGRRSIYVNRPFTLRIEGLPAEESASLLERLCAQASIPELQCRFHWRVNSIAQWDNRSAQHYAVSDHGGHHRMLERVTILGDRPV